MSEGLDRRVEGMLDRLVTVGSSTLSIRSVTFQNSLRLAAGLALALVLGGVFEVENGFWVLFATLSVVRTSAPMTGASAFQAVFGTVIGFAIALPLLLAIGTREDLYLLVLPIVTVGGLLAGSLNVVWGQAGFTVLVLVLFNLVDPIGWEIGIIRVEDVALGAAVGVLIGLAAWPRGATGQLAQSLADAVEASGSLVAATMEGRLRPVSPERLSRLRSRARQDAARRRRARRFPHRATQEFRGRRDLGAGVDVRSHPLVRSRDAGTPVGCATATGGRRPGRGAR